MELEVHEAVGPLDRDVEAARGTDELPVHGQDVHDLAHGDGRDGEVVTAEPEDGRADELREGHRDQRADHHGEPRRGDVFGDEDPGGVGAGAEEDRVAERDLSTVAGEDISGCTTVARPWKIRMSTSRG